MQLHRRLPALVFIAAACGGSGKLGGDGGATEPCTGGVDLDGDNYGDFCPAGPDCNDLDPAVHADCADADCTAAPFTGCPCDPATDAPFSCFDGPAASATVPPCEKGLRTCDPTSSLWGGCVGQILPAFEECDGVDNDCDLTADEAPADCSRAGIDTEPFPLPPEPDVGADGVGLDPNGDLVLDSSTIENHHLWIANDRQGTVSKIDTRTGREVARYASVTHDAGAFIDATGGAGAPVPAWDAGTSGGGYAHNRPSRTAVDYDGNVWVGNRAFGYQPSATKILNVVDECIDRNGNGAIDTSRDANDDGVIDVGGGPPEFWGEADECIRFTVRVGANDGVARAVAIDSGIEPGDPGNAWIGMYNEQAFYQIDGETGALLQRVPPAGPSGISPYGAAIDSLGNLWAPHGCCGGTSLLQINTTTSPATTVGTIPVPALSAAGSYGIVVDLEDRVWIGAWPQGSLKRYDPTDGSFAEVTIPDNFGENYGVRGVGVDAIGNVWAAIHVSTDPYRDGRVARVDADTATARDWWDILGEVPVGVGVDFDGHVWTVNQNSSNASRMYIDPVTREPLPHPATGNTVDTFPVGPNPYTYSDFTGLGLRVVTRPQGDYRVVKEGCPGGDPATWMSVTWTATTPPGTRVEIWARSGDDRATLSAQPQYGPWTTSPADLGAAPGPVPPARFLELTIRLISDDRESTPIVHSYALGWACPGEPIP